MQAENFGRLVKGNLVFAPKPLVTGGVKVYTNNPQIYAANGWYEIIRTEQPDDSKRYTYYWAADDEAKTITQVWTELPMSDDDIPDIEDPTAEDNISYNERLADIEDAICELYDMILMLLE